MSDPYVGEIKMFGGNFAPSGWMFCQGQSLPISENETLFQLIGTTYGGDGQSSFNLPNLAGRVPVHQGNLAGGSNYVMAQVGGAESVTLTTPQLPAHNHPLLAAGGAGDSGTPQQNQALASMGPASSAGLMNTYAAPGGTQVTLAGTSIGLAGGNQPHANIQPSMGINFIISLYGVYPSQT